MGVRVQGRGKGLGGKGVKNQGGKRTRKRIGDMGWGCSKNGRKLLSFVDERL